MKHFHWTAGRSGAFRVALCLCSIVAHIIIGMVGVYGCTIDENIPRFVLARSSLFLLDISYVIGYAMLKEPSKKLLFVPEIRYIGSLVLAIAGALCIYRRYEDVQHTDSSLQTYCNVVCYWFAFGAVTADLVFYSLLNLICCYSLLSSLHVSFRKCTHEPNVDV
ncbi:hypothetical protein Tcan_12359 [Toxocara canis]|uniref:MARVEL domain-containing protein n=1 Tax=Toxocara canis TaxID=6265 RepID=A0A0B2W4J4_TOXCA|nr:hypothetical protein Tcan_12359 [Toxocara canis]